jgi:hypothetical protein
MDWFYALNGQQQGPVSDAALDELLRSGTINPDTLVWHNALADWQPLKTARERLPPPVLPVPGGAPTGVCVECRRTFPQSEMLFLNQCWVCAECKPVFLQRLREGSAPQFAPDTIWRFKKQMVARSETPLPDRCIRCNTPAGGYKLKRRLSWHSPVIYLLIFINVLIYVIVALIVRKKALLHVGLCENHRRQRSLCIAGAWLGFLGGVSLIGCAIAWGSGLAGLVGVVAFIASIVFYFAGVPVIRAAKIDKELVWVRGAGPAFLAQLPEWSGR